MKIKTFKKAILIGFFMVLISMLILCFLKKQYNYVKDDYEPTISLNAVSDLSNTKITEKLFTMYMEHYKDKSIFDDQRIKDYKYIGSTERYAVKSGTVFSITYSFQQHFWNEYWEIGSGHAVDGMIKTIRYVVLIKEKDQFRLKIMGISPPDVE